MIYKVQKHLAEIKYSYSEKKEHFSRTYYKARDRYYWVMIYVLVTIIWASAYSLIYTFFAEGFSFSQGVSPQSFCVLDWLYFSMVTITTLGYGEIVPNETPVRIFVASEALLGLFFLGMFLNQIAKNIAKDAEEKHIKYLVDDIFSKLMFFSFPFSKALYGSPHPSPAYDVMFHKHCSDLLNYPDRFDFDRVDVEGIYIESRALLVAFQRIEPHLVKLPVSSRSPLHTIITTLTDFPGSTISDGSIDRSLSAVSLQHKAYIIFMNAHDLYNALKNEVDIYDPLPKMFGKKKPD